MISKTKVRTQVYTHLLSEVTLVWSRRALDVHDCIVDGEGLGSVLSAFEIANTEQPGIS
jgi:hypothetical protein